MSFTKGCHLRKERLRKTFADRNVFLDRNTLTVYYQQKKDAASISNITPKVCRLGEKSDE